MYEYYAVTMPRPALTWFSRIFVTLWVAGGRGLAGSEWQAGGEPVIAGLQDQNQRLAEHAQTAPSGEVPYRGDTRDQRSPRHEWGISGNSPQARD